MLFIAATLIVLTAVCGYTQDETPTFRTGVTDVRFDVQVVDGTRPVTDLTKEDFILTDEGQNQAITYFAHENESVNLLLLLDISGSMTKYISDIAQTARESLATLRPGDRVAIMVFGKESAVHQEFSDNIAESARQIANAVTDHDVGAGTLINSAVASAANYVQEHAGPRGRRAILVLTDNLSLSFRLTDGQVIRELDKSDTVLNAIVVGRAIRPAPPAPGKYVNPDYSPADVFHLAEATGGEAVKATQPELTFAEMVERIRGRYTLAYPEPSAPSGTFRRVQITLSPAARRRYPNAQIRARSGYQT